MTCKKHPRYKGRSRPRTDCIDCWKIYVERPMAEYIDARVAPLLSTLKAKYDDLKASFDRHLKVDQRAIEHWRRAHPEFDMKNFFTALNHADLYTWLMDRVDQLERALVLLKPIFDRLFIPATRAIVKLGPDGDEGEVKLDDSVLSVFMPLGLTEKDFDISASSWHYPGRARLKGGGDKLIATAISVGERLS